MSPALLQFYHSLPAIARDVVASTRGFQLKRWRYGPSTDELVAQALERESWTREEWSVWQENRLAEILHRAATQVPYYRSFWSEQRRRGNRRTWEDLANWPILKKEDVRKQLEAFLADDCDRSRMFCDQTSGTSGTPLKIWSSLETVRAWYALFEARIRNWNGVSRHERWAIIGGQQVIRGEAQSPPYWVRNWPIHQLYLSANHISAASVFAYWRAIEDFRPTHVIAYSSSGAALAREFLAAGLKCSTLGLMISNAEPLLPWQRDSITRSLAPIVRESYGMCETVAAASECVAGRLHFWPDVGYVEALQDHELAPTHDGATGRFVCTGLLNSDMPLIRYEVGDRGSAPLWDNSCPCGRALPLVHGIEGRTSDELLTQDGRRIFWVNPAFYGLPVNEAQIIQESLQEIRVRIVPGDGFSAESESIIKARLRDRLGSVRVKFEKADLIPRGPNGKFRPVICNVKLG